jgi:AraC family transcriptional regulator
MIQPRFESLKEKKLVGKYVTMSLANNKTFDLWRSFMPERMKIQNRISNDMISMRVYSELLQLKNIEQQFEKWAVVEVSDFDNVADGMKTFILKEGLYAVFDYKGLNTDNRIFIYIFNEWLPNSNYELDERPHFEVLGEKYRNNDPESEEEIWIPIRPKQ